MMQTSLLRDLSTIVSNLIDSEYDFNLNMYRSYGILKRTSDIDTPIIYERLMMYSEVFGSDDSITPQSEGIIPLGY